MAASSHLPAGRTQPSGYSEATSIGDLVAVSGQLPSEDVLERGAGFAEQFFSALARFAEALESARATPADLLHVRIYVTDVDAYGAARPELAPIYRDVLSGHYPAATLVEVSRLIDGRAVVEIDGLARRQRTFSPSDPGAEAEALIRLRLGPADARYGERMIAGAKVLELFGDLETEIAIRTGGDEGLCVGYDSVEFLAPLYVGDFVEARARVVGVGKTSRRIEADLYRVIGADSDGVGVVYEPPILAARATATIVPARRQG